VDEILGMYNQYIKKSIDNSDANHKRVPCSVSHSVMKSFIKILFTIPVFLLIVSSTAVSVWATNQSSYEYGYMNGSLKDPQFEPNSNWKPELGSTCHLSSSSILNTAAIMPAVTNVTACEDGFFAGYKDWCINHAVDCVENMTMGDFPDMILKAHDQILAGAKAANSSGNSMCPIGENAAFCRGWDSNNDDYGTGDCSDSPLANISYGLMGCAQDIMTINQIGGAGLYTLVGTWNYVNESNGSLYSGKIVYGANGDFNLTIPNHNEFGDYELEGAWGYIGHNILTECYAGGCENNTLMTITPNHIEFQDNHNNIIHLMKVSTLGHVEQQQSSIIERGTKLLTGINNLDFRGTWVMNPDNSTGKSTITFYNYVKYAPWKYTKYCCDVDIQKFTTNIGHRVFEGYWQSETDSPFPQTLDLCANNMQDHGQYRDDVPMLSHILSRCTEMTVDIIDNNHVNLHNAVGDTIYLIRGGTALNIPSSQLEIIANKTLGLKLSKSTACTIPNTAVYLEYFPNQ
jgi:hypothetical protein